MPVTKLKSAEPTPIEPKAKLADAKRRLGQAQQALAVVRAEQGRAEAAVEHAKNELQTLGFKGKTLDAVEKELGLRRAEALRAAEILSSDIEDFLQRVNDAQ